MTSVTFISHIRTKPNIVTLFSSNEAKIFPAWWPSLEASVPRPIFHRTCYVITFPESVLRGTKQSEIY